MVIKKSVQAYMTEFLVCDALVCADDGMRLFYVLPKIEIRNNFVRDRVNRLLLSVPYYRSRTRKGHKENILDIDNVGLKAFGEKGVLFFVGSNSRSSFISYPADKIIIDELDFCDQSNLELAEDRMKASPYRHRIDVSTPTRQDFGIDKLYNQSDKKAWFITCPECGCQQVLDFFVNVLRSSGDQEWELLDTEWDKAQDRDIRVFCRKCRKPIDRLAEGEWIAEFPDRSVSGYTISGLMSAERTVRSLFDAFNAALKDASKLQVFYNSDLGQAYTAAGQKLTPVILNQCIKAGLNYNMPSRGENTTMGVDVGQPLIHVWICDHPGDGPRRLIWAGTVREFEELHMIVALFGVKWAVVDEKPETRKAREFQEAIKSRCKVWLCRYPPTAQIEDLKINDEEETIISADRTQALDALVADFYNQVLLLPVNVESLEDGEVYRQLCAPTRVFNEGQGHYQWVNDGKPDHFFHAGGYERLASRLRTETDISERYAGPEQPKPQWFQHYREKQ